MSASTDTGGAFELKLDYESNRCSMLSLVVLEIDQDEDRDEDLDTDASVPAW